MASAREAAVAEYQETLEELSFNSKPHINMLTMLADENQQFSPHIVKIIEDRLLQVAPDKKLPILYLIDSIMKNVAEKGNYKEHFLHNITSVFITVFDKVDEKTRGSMFKLRHTWTDIFPEKKLYSIDLGCHSVDPAWPVAAKPPTSQPAPPVGNSIHVNPKFLKQNPGLSVPASSRSSTSSSSSKPSTPSPSKLSSSSSLPSSSSAKSVALKTALETSSSNLKTSSTPASSSGIDLNNVEAQIRQNLIAKQQEMLKAKETKLQKELAEMKRRLEAAATTASETKTTDSSVSAKTPSKEELQLKSALDKPKSSNDSSLPLGANLRDPRIRQKAGIKPSSHPKIELVAESTGASLDLPQIPVSAKPPSMRIPKKIDSGSAGKSVSETRLQANVAGTHKKSTSSKLLLKSQSSQDLVKTTGATTTTKTTTPLATTTLLSPVLSRPPPSESPEPSDEDVKSALAGICEEAAFSPVVSDDDGDSTTAAAVRMQANFKPKPVPIKPSGCKKARKEAKKAGTNRQILADIERQKQMLVVESDKSASSISGVGDAAVTKERGKSVEKDAVTSSSSSSSAPAKREAKNTPIGSKKSNSSSGTRSPDSSTDVRASTPSKSQSSGGHRHRNYRERGGSGRSDDRSEEVTGSPLEKRARSESPGKNPSPSTSSLAKEDSASKRSRSRSPHHQAADEKGNRDPRLGQAQSSASTAGKRANGDSARKNEEPPVKKSKEDDIKALFGSEDQDLRRLATSTSTTASDSGVASTASTTTTSAPLKTSMVVPKHNLLSAFSDAFSPLIPPSMGNFAKFCGRHAAVMGPAEEQLRLGNLTAENLKDIILNLVEIEKSGATITPVAAEPSRDPRIRGRTGTTPAALPSLPHVVDYGHGRRSPAKTRAEEETSLWESRHGSSVPSTAPPSLLSSPGRDISEEKSLRDDALKTMGKAAQHQQRLHFDVETQAKDSSEPSSPVPNVKEILQEQPKDGVDPRHRMLLKNAQHRGNRREGVGRTLHHELIIDDESLYVHANKDARRIWFRQSKISVRVDTENKEVWIDSKLVYRIGDLPRQAIVGGRPLTVWLKGPPVKFWIDDILFEMRYDSPPQRMPLDGQLFSFHCYSFTNELYVDTFFITKIGGSPRDIVLKRSPHIIRFDPPPREIIIDGSVRAMSYLGVIPVVLIPPTLPPGVPAPIGGPKLIPHGIRFDGPDREIFIDGEAYLMPMNRAVRIRIDKRSYEAAFGGPFHEVIIDGKIFNVDFDGMERPVTIGGKTHNLRLEAPTPEVKILGPTDPETGHPIQVHHGPKKYSTSQVKTKTEPSSAETAAPKVPTSDVAPSPAVDQPMPPPPVPLKLLPPSSVTPSSASTPMPELAPPPPAPFIDPPNSLKMIPGLGNEAAPTAPVAPASALIPSAPFVPPDFVTPVLPTKAVDPLSSLLPGISNSGVGATGDVNSLFEKLVAAGIISKQQQELATSAASTPSQTTEAASSTDLTPPAKATLATAPEIAPPVDTLAPPTADDTRNVSARRLDEPIARKAPPPPSLLDWNISKLKTRYDFSISALYRGPQCSTCGVRFDGDRAAAYSAHLDWHFRHNRRDQESYRKASSRKWYYPLEEWVQFEEISELDEAASSSFFERAAAAHRQVGEAEIVSCPVAGDREDAACEICSEPFEQFWDEDEEEWHLKDAVRIKERTYHPVCYEDFKETSFMDLSTSPTSESILPFMPPLIESTPKPRRVKPLDKPSNTSTDRRTPSPEDQDAQKIGGAKDSSPTTTSPQKALLPPEMAMDYDSNSSRESAESGSITQQSLAANELTTAITPQSDEKSSSMKLETPMEDETADVSAEKRPGGDESSPSEASMESSHEVIPAEENRALLLTNDREGVNSVIYPAIVASREEGAMSPTPIVKFESNTMSPVNNDDILPPPIPLSGASTSRGGTPPPVIKVTVGSGGGGGAPPSALDILSNLLTSSSSSTPTSSPVRGESSSSSQAGKGAYVTLGTFVEKDTTSVSLPGLDLVSSSPEPIAVASPRDDLTESALSSSRPTSSAASAVASTGVTASTTPTPTGLNLMAALLAQAAKGVGNLPRITVSGVASASNVAAGSEADERSESMGRASPQPEGADVAVDDGVGLGTAKASRIPATTPAPLTLTVGGYTLTIPAGAMLSSGASTSIGVTDSKASESSSSHGSSLVEKTDPGKPAATPTDEGPTPTVDEPNPFGFD